MSAGPWNLLLPLILAGSQCLVSQDLKRTDLATLQGRTINSLTGATVGNVNLTLRALPPGTDSQNLSSDAEGRFSFEEMEPGSYILTGRGFGSDRMPLKLPPGQVLKDIEFRLTPLGIISGSVVDEQGKPVSKARVSVASGSLRGSVVVDEAGEFRLPGLKPGSYVLSAAPAAERPDKSEELLVTTYYPSATDAAGTIPLAVGPGQELAGITIALQKQRSYRVRGTVVASSPHVSLLLTPRAQDGGQSFSGTMAPDGSFTVERVPPGSYYLEARSSRRIQIAVVDGSPPEVTGSALLGCVPVDVVNAEVTGVVLRAGTPLEVLGTLRMEGRDETDFSGLSIQLRLLDSRIGSLSRATVGDKNTITFEDVSPARHAVVVSDLPANAYLKSIRLGGREAIDSSLDLTDMQTVPPLDIVISPNGATVEGAVNRDDDKPAPGAGVYLIPDPARPELASRVKSATAAGDGKFAFTGVAPGEYRLYAFEELQKVSLGNLEILKPFETKAEKLTVKENETKRADLKAYRFALGSRLRQRYQLATVR